MTRRLLTVTEVCVVVIAISSMLWAWYNPYERIEYQQLEVPRIYRVISKETITVPVKVYVKGDVVEKEKWPDWFSKNDDLQLIGVGVVPPYKGETECSAVLNIKTGETTIYGHQKPIPLFGFERDLELGAIVGTGVAAYGRYTFARMGKAYLGANATYVFPNTGILGIDISFRF